MACTTVRECYRFCQEVVVLKSSRLENENQSLRETSLKNRVYEMWNKFTREVFSIETQNNGNI